MKSKAIVYIDGANMFYAQQKMGWFIDWLKVKEYLNNRFKIVKINYYTGIKDNDTKTKKFNKRLSDYGFQLITKPLKKIRLPKDQFIYKANFDVEIAVDLLLDSQRYETAILFSGDSDFECLVKKLKNMDKKVIVCSSRSALSKELTKVASQTILLGNIRREIEFK